jgi:ABC-2 family transporter
MTWLTLRLLRPYLIAAGTLTAAATAFLLHAAGVVQRQLDADGTPDCHDPNVCYPYGEALNAVLGIQLVAAFVPPLLGLILGVAVFAPEREQGTLAFALTQSVPRHRWVRTKLAWALAAGLVCAVPVAVLHRSTGTRYTALASDTYELLQLLHLDNAGFMVAQTVLLVALGGVLGLTTGRTLPTLVLTAVAGPFAFLAAAAVAVLLSYPLRPLLEGAGSSSVDPFAYLVSAVVGAGVLALLLLAPRLAR